ncbi:OstA-like protein [Lacinutrix sp.]|uniref:OstA-like protein n=1 Tax=Lacinutrix sp. TaxID=1937692 RepID=UPI0026193FAF|nr:OstA-like protein [Lacinutrix sp.]MDG1714967.1 OstA-like protein [Lacinutrix sp.]
MFKTLFILFFLSLMSFNGMAQQRKNIEIKDSGAFGEIDEEKYPGARILTRSDAGQVHVYHDGIDMYCDQAVLYGKENFVEAYGNVKMVQGDTITMIAKYAEYSGKTQLAYAKGDVVLTEPSSVLTTQKLFFDRAKQEAFYNEDGKVVRDSSGTITSRVGRYYMSKKKYRFLKTVELVNPEYILTTNQLDFYSETGHAFMFGASKIVGETSTVYCERGFYNTNNDTGYFTKNSRIDYDNRVVVGDSMYFDRNRDFASASNNITITDTINNSIIKGHYAEVYKSKDSAFVTKRALAISVQENDSIYIHSDTLMVTGKEDNRITRAFRNARLFKSDVSGKADSIHVNHQTGLTQLINISRLSKKDAFAVKRRPILWNLTNQITGDTIHLKSNPKTEKLDSLIVFENAFIISKDTLSTDYFSQIKGKRLVGLFDEGNQLKQVNIFKNAESVFVIRDENDEFVGLDKARSANIEMYFAEGGIYYYKRLIGSEANTYPEKDIPKGVKKLKDFDWRPDERPLGFEDLFKDDPPLNLPIIKGLAPALPEEEFFDEDLLNRLEQADLESKPKLRFGDARDDKPLKASRQIPTKQVRDDIKRANPNQSKPINKVLKKTLPTLNDTIKKKE